MNKLIIISILSATFSKAIAAELISGSHLFIEKFKIEDKLTSKLSHRKFDSRLFILERGKNEDILRFLGEPYNLEDVSGGNASILNLTISTYGILEGPDNEISYHDVTSCVFIEKKNGCVLYTGSINLCAGNWKKNKIWLTDEGVEIDFIEVRKTILSGKNEGKRKENYFRCGGK